jgi:hypothetical protein
MKENANANGPVVTVGSLHHLTMSCSPSARGDTRTADAAAMQALDEQWPATAGKDDLRGANYDLPAPAPETKK